MIKSESIVKIAVALLKAQRNMGNASKDAKNPFFKSKYADLNSVREVAHPALNAEGISILQPTINKDGRNYVETLLLHESGEYIGSETEIVCKEAHNPQAMGAAISYSRRYSLQSLLSIGAEDNDAEGAMNRVTPIAQKVVETKQNGSFNNNKKTVTPVAAKPAPAALDESGWD